MAWGATMWSNSPITPPSPTPSLIFSPSDHYHLSYILPATLTPNTQHISHYHPFSLNLKCHKAISIDATGINAAVVCVDLLREGFPDCQLFSQFVRVSLIDLKRLVLGYLHSHNEHYHESKFFMRVNSDAHIHASSVKELLPVF